MDQHKKVKKGLAIFLLTLCMLVQLFPLSAFAAGAVDDYNSGDDQSISNEDKAYLQSEAARVSAACGMDVAFLFASPYYAKTQTLSEFATEYYQVQKKLGEDGFVLAIDRKNAVWTIAAFGRAQTLLTPEVQNELFAAYDDEETFYGGVLAYLYFAEASFPPPPPESLSRVAEGEQLPRLTDDVGLLTQEEAAELLAKLDEISERQKFDVVVAVVPALDSREARLYAADFMEENGFGYAGTDDCAILLLAVENRDFGFAAQGYGLQVFTEAGQEYLDKLFLPNLKQDRYFEAFMAFADAADEFISQADSGEPYDKGNIPRTPSERLGRQLLFVFISLAAGLAVAGIATSRWKKQLKSVVLQAGAAEYVRPGSLVVTGQQDVLLYSNVSRSAKPKESNNSSGGNGGGSFSSSSGKSTTGHSGKY